MGFAVSLRRAVAAFRLASLLYAGLVLLHNEGSYAHPVLGWVGFAVMAAWTVAITAAYAVRGMRWPWLVADLAMGILLVLATPLVENHARIVEGAQTISVTWSVVPVAAWAVAGGALGGVGAGLAVALADVLERGALTSTVASNSVYVLLTGLVIGYLAQFGRRAELALHEAVETQAATAERERLARDIHDSVLQVLALVQRRGQEIGGEAAELATLAGEQESSLRALGGAPPQKRVAGEPVDLRELLAPRAGSAVSISSPATPVLLPQNYAEELAAAVGAALDNVRHHAGPEARAWVLVEDEGDQVVVSVRDDGVGMPLSRPLQAAGSGRLGLAQSIRGRVADLGGETVITSAPGEGTEIELRVPRPREQESQQRRSWQARRGRDRSRGEQ
jgi:signal transduction histidine kinase